MDLATHALMGYAIAGAPGAVCGVLPDVPVLLADGLQFLTGQVTLRDALAGTYPPVMSVAVASLLDTSDLMHSAWTWPLVFAGPPGWAYVAHVALDLLVHFRTRLWPPFGVVVSSPVRWTWRKAVVAWAVLAVVCIWRS